SVEISRQSPHSATRIDRRAAADTKTAKIQGGVVILIEQRVELRPMEFSAAYNLLKLESADLRRSIRRAIIASSFKQQHAGRTMFRQSRGQRRASRSRADHDVIVCRHQLGRFRFQYLRCNFHPALQDYLCL